MESQTRLLLNVLHSTKTSTGVGVLTTLAFVLKLLYVLYGTTALDSIHNDMAVYWIGALRNNWGNAASFEQYAIFPPFYIYFLACFLKIFFVLNLMASALPLILIFNIAFNCLSSIFLFMMVNELTGNRKVAFGAQFFYLFSYTALNLAGLILPDSMATSFLVIAIGLLVTQNWKARYLFLSGLILGVAISAKPMFAVFAPVFIFHVFFGTDKKKGGFNTLILSLGICLVPLATVGKNYQISNGKLLGLGVNGGVNFYQGWGQIGKINSESAEGTYGVHSPGALDELTWKEAATTEPFYHQGYFYRKGFDAIAADPSVLIKKIFWLKKLFFGNIGPFLSQLPKGYSKIIFGYNLILYLMFVLSLTFLPLLNQQISDKALKFLMGLTAIFFVSVYAMALPERRYLTYIEPLIITFFFLTMSQIKFLYRFHRKDFFLTTLCLTSFFIVLPATFLILNRYVG